MASPAYELILAIQALDLSIDQLRRRGAAHPARAELATIDDELVEDASKRITELTGSTAEAAD